MSVYNLSHQPFYFFKYLNHGGFSLQAYERDILFFFLVLCDCVGSLIFQLNGLLGLFPHWLYLWLRGLINRFIGALTAF